MNLDDGLLPSFNINKLDARLGFELSRRAGQLGVSGHDDGTIQTVEIQFAVKPFSDLIIDRDVEVLLIVPKHYLTHGSIRAHIFDKKWVDYLRGRMGDNGALQLPSSALQQSKTQYPFIVWFHLIRSYFKVRFDTPWVSAPLLDSQFMLIHADWPVHMDRNGSSRLSLYCGAGRTRGRRGYMEDVDFTFESLRVDEQRCVNIYGVLDGHGGRDCAQFCADEIPMKIVASLRSGCQCTEALYRSFIDTDSEFLQSDSVSNAGTTANVAVYDAYRNVFYVANTGDTRAVLCRHGKALDLTYDRKGSDPEEISRIIAAGGFVSQGRVMGSLAVTRALGDIQLKEQGDSRLRSVLIPDPELSCFYPTVADEFVVIATDGLWDVMTSQAAVDLVRGLLVENNLLTSSSSRSGMSSVGADVISMSLAQIANKVAVHSVSSLGSMDNVTVLIVLLKGGPVAQPDGMAMANRSKVTTSTAQSVDYSRISSEYLRSHHRAPPRSKGSPSSDKVVEAITTTVSTRQATVVFARHTNTGAHLLSASSASVPHNDMKGGKAATSASLEDEDDDLLDFLNDDSNF